LRGRGGEGHPFERKVVPDLEEKEGEDPGRVARCFCWRGKEGKRDVALSLFGGEESLVWEKAVLVHPGREVGKLQKKGVQGEGLDLARGANF